LRAVPERIEDADRLLRIFGEWPSFHDAEVVGLSLERDGANGPSLDLRIHVFETTPELDPAGCCVQKNHTLVTLRFLGLELEHLVDFNEQNVLFDLHVTPLDPGEHEGRRIGVRLASSYGLGGEFQCSRCVVADVRPYSPSA